MEEAKNLIIEILQSDEIKEYIVKLLHAQTNEIVRIITETNGVKQSSKNNEEENILELQDIEMKVQREELQRKYDELRNECTNKDKIISSSKDDIEQLKNNYQKLKQEKDEVIASIQDKLGDYEKKYAKIEKAFSKYQSLTDDVKMRLKNIFGSGSIYSFVAATTEWNNIEGIWNFAKRRIIENENKDAECLVSLFRFLFDTYSECVNNRTYKLICPEIGERYDSDRHSIKGIRTDGKISEVLLEGIYDIVDKKVVYKAVVIVQ